MIRFASLGSGSKGNATLIQAGSCRVLVDCGFSAREAESRLLRLGVEPQSLNALLVTHEHGDHLGGVARFARRFSVPVMMTNGTRLAWNDSDVPHLRLISPHQSFSIGELTVHPYPVPHDAREPCQYAFDYRGRRLGVLSDAGHVTPHMRQLLETCDALMLECNHDPGLLAAGPYPAALKRRVGGPLGHLANAQSAALLRQMDGRRLQHLVLTHLSEVNNTPEHALAAIAEVLQERPSWLACADQRLGLEWRELV